MLKQLFSNQTKIFKQLNTAIIVLLIATVGIILLVGSHAATPYDSSEAEGGTVAGGAASKSDPNASGGQYVQFGGTGTGSGCPAGQVSTTDGQCVQLPTGTTNLAFDDEFDGTTLNTTQWAALNRPGDSSNNEAECYSPNNVSVSGGYLQIVSKVDSSCSGYKYTSGFVQWKSFNFLYGTIEYRTKEPGGTGTWPAQWMLGHNCQQSNITSADNIGSCNWPVPGSDEVDVSEIYGSAPDNVNEGVISSLGSNRCYPSASDVSQNWHTYDLVWAPGSLTYKIDGVTTCHITGSYVPTQAMFFMINTALGGDSGGTINNSTLPQTMQTDYVRVYQ